MVRVGTLEESARAQQITGAAVQTAGAAIGGAASTGLILSAAWVPVIGAAVVAITLGLNAIFNRRSAQQKVVATQIVDDLEPKLAANVQAYLSGPRTEASQTYALANFDRALDFLRSNTACGSADLGSAGQRCISERDRGGKWDWYAIYRDPIAQDTPRPNSIATALFPASQPEDIARATNVLPWVLIGLGILLW